MSNNPQISKVQVDLIEMRNGRSAIVREIGSHVASGVTFKVDQLINDGAIELRPQDGKGRVYRVNLTQLIDRAADQINCYHAALAADQDKGAA